jgi:hypothetical protein
VLVFSALGSWQLVSFVLVSWGVTVRSRVTSATVYARMAGGDWYCTYSVQ